MKKANIAWALVAGVVVVAATPRYGLADPIADFYRGKQIKLIIRAGPGGNYDTYSRILGRYIVRFLPGNPKAVPINMPGGGGLTALNYVENVAPHDGTILSMVTQSLPMEQALGLNTKLKVDMRRLNWIGNMSEANMFLLTTPSSKTRTLDDAMKRRTFVAATGSASVSTYITAVANNLLGTRFKVIYGYPSGPEMNMAMARGEAEGRTTSNPARMKLAGQKVKFNYILQAGIQKNRDYPDTPLFKDLAKNKEDQLVLDFLSKVISLARPVVTNSGVPAERVKALRAAFTTTMKDPGFKKDADKIDIPISYMSGEELQSIVASIVDAPKPTLDRVRDAIKFRSGDIERGKMAKKKKKKKK